jgi:hypothetical protein
MAIITTGNGPTTTIQLGALGAFGAMNQFPAEGEFLFYKNQWISGSRIMSNCGLLSSTAWCKDVNKVGPAIDKALLRLATKGVRFSAKVNACVALQIHVDPWHERKNGDIVVHVKCEGLVVELAAL